MAPSERPPRPGPRKLPRQERSSALFEAILEAARLTIRERGTSFTLAQVAERAGVSPGSFYQYFPDRRALVGTLIDQQIALDRARLSQLEAALEATPIDRFPQMISEGLLGIYSENPRLMSCMVQLMHELGRSEDLKTTVADFSRLLSGALTRQSGRALEICALACNSALSATLGMVRQTAETEPDRLLEPAYRARLEDVCRAALALPKESA